MHTPRVLTDVSVPTGTVPGSTRPPTRPTLLERSAMRAGLWLILWGRHRAQRRVDVDVYTRHRLAQQVWNERYRSDAFAAFGLSSR